MTANEDLLKKKLAIKLKVNNHRDTLVQYIQTTANVEKRLNSGSSLSFADWYAGITNNAERRRGEHRAEYPSTHWKHEVTESANIAEAVEKSLEQLGCDVGKQARPAPTKDTIVVYVYKKIPRTTVE